MQQMLRIMPEAIPEVPRDNNNEQFQDFKDNRSGQFDSVYQKQLDRGSDSAPEQSMDKAAKIDAARSGNETRQQQNDESVDGQSQIKDGKATAANGAQTDSHSDKAKLQGASTAAIDPDKQAQLGDEPNRDKIDGKLEQLLLLMEKSGQVLRNPGNIAPGELNGQTGEALHRHNKLAAAIEGALKQNGEKFDLAALAKAYDKEGGLNLNSAEGKLVAQELKQLLLSEDGKALQSMNLDSVQKEGILRELKALLNAEGDNSGLGKYQTPGINGLPNSDSQGGEASEVKPQTAGIKPSKAEFIKPGLEQDQTPPVRVDGDEAGGEGDAIVTKPMELVNDGKLGMPAKTDDSDKPVKPIKPSLMENLADAGKPTQKPPELTGQIQGDGKFDLEQDQTPDIKPNLDGAEVKGGESTIKPMEMATKPNPFVATNLAAQQAAQDDAQVVAGQTKPMEKADPVLSAMLGSGEKRDGSNILGTKDGNNVSKSNMAINKDIQVSEQAQSGQAAIDESKLAELNMEENLNPEQFSEQRQILDDKAGRFVPRDLPLMGNGKPMQSSTGGIGIESLNNLNSLNQMADKMTAKTPTPLTEAMNIVRPDFGNNMKERLVVMMNKGIQTADIRLDPAELGQMQVKMSVENDVTTVNFVVQNSQAKELLEQAMPKLKDMLAEQGIELGEGAVHQEDKQQEQWQAGENGNGRGNGSNHESDEVDVEPIVAQQVKLTNGALGGIDFFA